MSETFEVLLWGSRSDHNPDVRKVHVAEPDEELWGLLEQIFYYGQNDVQPNSDLRSVSVGDFVKVNGEYFVCEPVGWSRFATGELLGVS
jgi:hypothetical protein